MNPNFCFSPMAASFQEQQTLAPGQLASIQIQQGINAFIHFLYNSDQSVHPSISSQEIQQLNSVMQNTMEKDDEKRKECPLSKQKISITTEDEEMITINYDQNSGVIIFTKQGHFKSSKTGNLIEYAVNIIHDPMAGVSMNIVSGFKKNNLMNTTTYQVIENYVGVNSQEFNTIINQFRSFLSIIGRLTEKEYKMLCEVFQASSIIKKCTNTCISTIIKQLVEQDKSALDVEQIEDQANILTSVMVINGVNVNSDEFGDNREKNTYRTRYVTPNRFPQPYIRPRPSAPYMEDGLPTYEDSFKEPIYTSVF